MTPDLTPTQRMLREARLIVTAGTGGVGKTTTAAALALQGALAGRRTAVLTIDPARRLANALGLDAFTGRAQKVPTALFNAAGLSPPAELSAMMLDMRATADEMVRRYAPNAEAAARIVSNPYYQAFSTSLAGTQEYMAVEQVADLLASGEFDLVVLDTPPATHALDFLDAPERLLNALDNRAINWLYRPKEATTRDPGYGARLLGKGRQMVFKSLNKFTGGPFFEDLAIFLQAFSSLFDAFRVSSRAVQALLRAESTQFLVVTAPYPATVREAINFRAQLVERGFPFGGFICNRVHLPMTPTTAAELRPELAAAGLAPGVVGPLAEDLAALVGDHDRMADRDALSLADLAEVAGGALQVVPLLPEDVHDLRGLVQVGEWLLGRRGAG
jgi:anion-transporting  ArsA/GET3 family ATPase